MNYFQIITFIKKLKTNSMNIIKLSNGQSVVTDNSPIKEGYCLNTNNNEVIYYNGNYGDEAPAFLKKITYSWPKLEGTKELKMEEALKHELEFWKEYEPVNGMGKYARQTRIDSIKNELVQLEDVGPEYDSAGFTEDDRIVNGQYKTNENEK